MNEQHCSIRLLCRACKFHQTQESTEEQHRVLKMSSRHYGIGVPLPLYSQSTPVTPDRPVCSLKIPDTLLPLSPFTCYCVLPGITQLCLSPPKDIYSNVTFQRGLPEPSYLELHTLSCPHPQTHTSYFLILLCSLHHTHVASPDITKQHLLFIFTQNVSSIMSGIFVCFVHYLRTKTLRSMQGTQQVLNDIC